MNNRVLILRLDIEGDLFWFSEKTVVKVMLCQVININISKHRADLILI